MFSASRHLGFVLAKTNTEAQEKYLGMQRVCEDNLKGTEGKNNPGTNVLGQGKNYWQRKAMKAFHV